jgi:hypothetical protein
MTYRAAALRRHHPVGTAAEPLDPPEPATPPFPAAEANSDRRTQVSLLAATALGLAFSSGSTDGNVHTLTSLGAPDAGILLEASAAVLELEVGPRHTRVVAADLLGRAARVCPCASDPSSTKQRPPVARAG